MSPQVNIPQSLWCTAGYLPGRRALPLGRYSFPVPLRVGGRVDLTGWLHTKMVYPRTVTHLSTNRARRRVTSLTWPMTLLVSLITTQEWGLRTSRYETRRPFALEAPRLSLPCPNQCVVPRRLLSAPNECGGQCIRLKTPWNKLHFVWNDSRLVK